MSSVRSGRWALVALVCAAGCVGVREQAMSNKELLETIRRRSDDLNTRISYAARRAGALKDKVRASRRIASELRAELQSAGVRVGPRGTAVVVGIASRLLFGPGRSELHPGAKTELERVATVLSSRFADRPICVEGHTDASRPWRTAVDFPTNWELSAARAVAVARYLIESAGVPAGRVSVAAYGDTRPIASNDTKEGSAQNRRVEIVLLPPIQTARVSALID